MAAKALKIDKNRTKSTTLEDLKKLNIETIMTHETVTPFAYQTFSHKPYINYGNSKE
jgi:hypothetical protein